MSHHELQEGLNIRPDDIVWIKNGKAHREDGPAIEHKLGYIAWYFEGKKHRLDGPAITWKDGTKKWYLNGELHREDGPACIKSDESKEWWLNDVQFTEDEFNQWLLKKQLNEKLEYRLIRKAANKRRKI